MFSEFGAPIIEGFDNHSNEYEACPNCYTDSDTGTIMRPINDSSDTDTSDEEENTTIQEEEEENRSNNSNNNSNNNVPTISVSDNTNSYSTDEEGSAEEDDEEDDAEEPDNENNENETDSEDDEDDPTATTEAFYGGNIEHFSNQEIAQKATSMNTILKAVMITCLFYVLAHKDAKKYIMGNFFKSVKGENYLYIAMVIFFIVFYLISVFL